MANADLVHFTDENGRFVAVVRELPKATGLYAVQPDMDALAAALPRLRKAFAADRATVWYRDQGDGRYGYTVRVRLTNGDARSFYGRSYTYGQEG